jgi:hypothetical protein
MQDKTVLVGSRAGRNEPPVTIGSPAQPSEPIGVKNRITRAEKQFISFIAIIFFWSEGEWNYSKCLTIGELLFIIIIIII